MISPDRMKELAENEVLKTVKSRVGYKMLIENITDETILQKLDEILIELAFNPDKYGLVDVTEAFMSIPTYKAIRDCVISKHSTIVDCGCGTGLQQLLFHDMNYIGIDCFNNYFEITGNFEHGLIEDILPTLELDSQVYLISVFCGKYFNNVKEVMIKKAQELKYCGLIIL